MGREGSSRGWDGLMASLTRWTWVWVSSGSWWWTGRPGALQSMRLQRVGHDWVTELNWGHTSIKINVQECSYQPYHNYQKHDALKVLHSICQQTWEIQHRPQDWKRCFHSNPKDRRCQRMLELPHSYSPNVLAKSRSQFSKPGFSNTWTENFWMFKLDLEKAEEPEIKLATSIGS